MVGLSAGQGAVGTLGVLAHGLHYAVLAIGLVGVVALLVPQLLEQRRRGPTASVTPRDDHEARVLQLRSAITDGSLATPRERSPGVPAPAAALATGQRILLPMAVVSSGAAAGVHAAVGPAHFREATLFGLFFALSALLQIVWAGAVAVACSRRLLLIGAVGNLAVVGLWAVTRTAGLPFGLLPQPEAVGPWDVACGGWELVIAACCLGLLREQGAGGRLAAWNQWHRSVRVFVIGSVLLLGALSVSGAGA